MDTGLMTIDFSEPLNVGTFTLDGLTIQCCTYLGDATNDPAEELLTYNLHPRESSLVSVSNLNRRLVYQLGNYNLNQIKARVGLASSQDTTYLSAWKPFVQDTSGECKVQVSALLRFVVSLHLFYFFHVDVSLQATM